MNDLSVARRACWPALSPHWNPWNECLGAAAGRPADGASAARRAPATGAACTTPAPTPVTAVAAAPAAAGAAP